MSDISRLLWRCRRGTREMDLLLEQFVRQIYPRLGDDERRQFEALLDESDADIMDWITGAARPDDPGYRRLVEYLRNPRPGTDPAE